MRIPAVPRMCLVRKVPKSDPFAGLPNDSSKFGYANLPDAAVGPQGVRHGGEIGVPGQLQLVDLAALVITPRLLCSIPVRRDRL